MANTKSAKKRARQTIRRTARNFTVRSQLKTAVRTAREAFDSGLKDAADRLSLAVSSLAKAAKKGVIHKKTAARKASRLMKRANAAAKAPAPAAVKTKAKAKTGTKAAAKK